MKLTSSSPPKLNRALGLFRSLCCFLSFAARALGATDVSTPSGALSVGVAECALGVLDLDFLKIVTGASASIRSGLSTSSNARHKRGSVTSRTVLQQLRNSTTND